MGNAKGIEIELFKKKGATPKDISAVKDWIKEKLEQPGEIRSYRIKGDKSIQTSISQTYLSLEDTDKGIKAEGISSWNYFEDQLILMAVKHKMYGTIKVNDFDMPGHWIIIIPPELTYKDALKQQKEKEARIERIAKEAIGKNEGMKA